MAFCPHCGKEISGDATACSNCEKDIKPQPKSDAAKFKGTILMQGAEAHKQVQSKQPAQEQTATAPKRGFQGTILGTGPMVAEAIRDANKEQMSAATVLQSGSARPTSTNQGVSSPSKISSPPRRPPQGGTIIAGSIPTPFAPESGKPFASETPQREASTSQTENANSSNVSSIGKTELAVPQMSMPVPEAQEPISADSEVPILKQPEEFDFPRKSKKSSLGTWLAIGCFGMLLVGAVIGGIAYFLLS